MANLNFLKIFQDHAILSITTTTITDNVYLRSLTESRGRLVNTTASYSGGIGFKSRPAGRPT
jgi:hypothetical protein